jgi:hypothetical protein
MSLFRRSPKVSPEDIERNHQMLESLPLVEAPDAVWKSIERSLDQQRPASMATWKWALAAVVIVVSSASIYWVASQQKPTVGWNVARVSGAPMVNDRLIHTEGRVSAGQWIETDASSSAKVKVGEIGSVEVAPNTRIQVVTTKQTEHRLALARGEIHAVISAPPKLFFVDTAAGTAVDLGCAYSLKASEDGSGVLSVTVGWVSFQTHGVESLVPAGASCRIRKPGGPGVPYFPAVPYFDDASPALKEAVDEFGLTKTSNLDVILKEARKRDTLTLWHLLSRVDADDRAKVADRMIDLTPLPSFLSRDLVLKGDSNTLSRWKDELMWTW